MIRLLIIADDFTGAMDTGVQLAKKGIRTRVALATQVEEALKWEDIEVLSLDAETRHLPSQRAYDTVSLLAKQAIQAGISCIYKKTDSALRGNVGAELDALLDVSTEMELIFLPAFPKGGRTTVNGIQYVEGVPLKESVFAKDPLNPICSSNISDILREQTQKPVLLVCKDEYEAGASMRLKEKTIVIYDAEEETDIKEAAKKLKENGKNILLAGCAGFAECLTELVEFKAVICEMERHQSGTLLVCGSVNPLAMNQLDMAMELGYKAITLNFAQKLGRMKQDEQERDILARELAQRMEQGEKILIRTLKSCEELPLSMQYAVEHGINKESISDLIADSIGNIIAKILCMQPIHSLIVFGGDTLLAILRHLKCSSITLEKEIVSGVVAAHMILPGNTPLLVTKAGGLGAVDVCKKIDAYLEKN